MVLVALAAAACQIASTPVAAPIVSPTPHTLATAAALQPGEAAPGLAACPDSGAMTAYLAALQASNPALAQKLSNQWAALKSAGADDAAVTLYAADPSACSAELAASGSVKSEATVVIAFADEGEADRAWQAGVFGFAPPPAGDSGPGVIHGKATGLGDASWAYTAVPIQLACWRHSVFVALLVVANLDGATFKAAAAAVNARLN